MLILKYQGRSLSQTKTERVYTQTYSGFENEIDGISPTPTIGTLYENKGYLTGIYKRPQQGGLWELELQYSLSFENTFSDAASTVVGVKSATLSSRTLQVSLSKLDNYLANWDHFLYCQNANNPPAFWSTATKAEVPNNLTNDYVWTRDFVDGGVWTKGEDRKLLTEFIRPTKQGVEYVEFSYYQVTQKSKYLSASDAGTALNKNINKLVAPQNTFGLTGSNRWKLDGGQIYYDGKVWICTNTYSYSLDSQGWDTDLYSTGSNNNSNN